MPLTRSFIVGAVAMAMSVALSMPASASAGPSFATANVIRTDPGGAQMEVIVQVEPSLGDATSRAISVRYEEGSFIFVDTAGILPQPGLLGVPEGNTCVTAAHDTVRCPVDLGDPAIVSTRFEVTTGGGDDRIDLRAMPDLPGKSPTQSTEARFRGPARPHFSTGRGDDIVLTGAYDADGDLGDGADRLKGGQGADGLPYVTRPGGGITGGRGRDRLIGGPGDDWLVGELGADVLKGGAGRDILVGGLGGDRLNSRDGEVDLVSCGPGNRRRQAITQDRIDKVLRHEGKPVRFGCNSRD